MLPDKRISRFMSKHHVLTLATSSKDGLPYCAACFYAYDTLRNRIIFTTDTTTRHGQMMERNPKVACAVNLETKVVSRVQGIQICGSVVKGDSNDKECYIKRFPYTALAPLNIWAIEPDFMKLTDNTLGFGKKLIWNRPELQ